MLFMLIDKGYQLDEVVFYDTGMEFQAIYNTRDAVLPILKKLGIKYTELHPEQPFLWTMFERPVKKRGTNIIIKKDIVGVGEHAGGERVKNSCIENSHKRRN